MSGGKSCEKISRRDWIVARFPYVPRGLNYFSHTRVFDPERKKHHVIYTSKEYNKPVNQ